jgi:cell wall assembly regulator SMI1
MNLIALEARFATLPEGCVLRGTPATDANVADAERALGVELPAELRAYLRHFGWIVVDGTLVFGLGPDVLPYADLVQITRSERTEMSLALPPYLLPLSNDGSGNLHCIDLRPGPPQGSIVAWDHDRGADQKPELLAPTFEQWLRDLAGRS